MFVALFGVFVSTVGFLMVVAGIRAMLEGVS